MPGRLFGEIWYTRLLYLFIFQFVVLSRVREYGNSRPILELHSILSGARMTPVPSLYVPVTVLLNMQNEDAKHHLNSSLLWQ